MNKIKVKFKKHVSINNLFIFILLILNTTKCDTHLNENPLLLFISFDGFRWDYLTKYNLTSLNYLKQIGSYSDYVYSSFATSTFPNHWSLVTGLYEESHGIVSNEMFDPMLNETFSMIKPNSHSFKWFGQNRLATPIWTLNQMNGNRRLSAAEWVGSNVVFFNQTIIDIPYEGSTPFNQYIDKFIKLFLNQTNPINFGAIYFNEPDQTGHMFGPFSNEMKLKLEEVDKNVGYLIDQLKKFNLFDSLNLIITSDHGMQNITNKTIIYLDDYVNTDLFDAYGGLVNLNLFIKNNSLLEFVYTKLKQIVNVDVYKQNEIPNHFNYKHNVRVGDILVAAQLGYTIYLNRSLTRNLLGEHGYNNNESSMHSIFIASGPRFKKNFKVKNFNNVDLYPLMCKVLNIEPASNNGSLDTLQDVLVNPKEKYKTIYIIISVIPIICATLTAIFLCYMNKPSDVLNMPSSNGYSILSTSEFNETIINHEDENENDEKDDNSGNSVLIP